MVFTLEPIVIAAIAAGATAALVLIGSGSLLLYRRYHPRPIQSPRTPASRHRKNHSSSSSRSRPSRHAHRSGDHHAMTHTPISSVSSTHKSPNPYHTPIVPRVQPPPPPSHRRGPSAGHQHQPSSSTFEYAPLESPETRSGSISKLRKYEFPSSAPRPRAKQTNPFPDTPDSQQPMISPPPNASRSSNASSVMLITYEQGLAKLGLSAIPRPLPSASTASASSHGAYPAAHSLGQHLPIPSPYSNYRSVGAPSPAPPPLPRSPSFGKAGYAPREEPRRERGSFPMTVTPMASHFGGEGYGGMGSERDWEDPDREPVLETARTGTWLPSYYQPAGDRYKTAPEAKSRWGGKI